MSKGNTRRGNKEIKKPKQVKAPILATAGSAASKPALNIGRKSPK
jgi:hypothetical protein